jgi:hypothetical protein
MVALAPLSAAVPRVVEPYVSVMLQVGVPPPGAFALTVRENVTDWPYTEVLGEEVSAVVVPSWLTICVRLEVLVMKAAWTRVAIRLPRIACPRLPSTTMRLAGETGAYSSKDVSWLRRVMLRPRNENRI